MVLEAKTTMRVVLIVALAASLTACRVEHDNPPFLLNARYHELPPELVDRLLKGAPGLRGKGIVCEEERVGGEYVGYCVCYGADSCRELAASDKCDAKIGAITHDTGVCRAPVQRVERVTVG